MTRRRRRKRNSLLGRFLAWLSSLFPAPNMRL